MLQDQFCMSLFCILHIYRTHIDASRQTNKQTNKQTKLFFSLIQSAMDTFPASLLNRKTLKHTQTHTHTTLCYCCLLYPGSVLDLKARIGTNLVEFSCLRSGLRASNQRECSLIHTLFYYHWVTCHLDPVNPPSNMLKCKMSHTYIITCSLSLPP